MAIDSTVFVEHVVSPGTAFEILLRGHLWVEALLNQLIEAEAKDPQALDLERMGFRQKVDIAQAFGLIGAGDSQAFGGLNKLRNKLAHNLDGSPSDAEIESLVDLLSGKPKAMFDAVVSTGTALGSGEAVGSRLEDLRRWFFCYAMHLNHAVEMRKYESANHEKLIQAAAIDVVSEMFGGDPSRYEEAYRQLGLPDPPDPRSDWRTTDPVAHQGPTDCEIEPGRVSPSEPQQVDDQHQL
jgi:hypothetical protein